MQEAREKEEQAIKQAAEDELEERKRSISAKRKRTGWQEDGVHAGPWKGTSTNVEVKKWNH